MEPFQSLAFQDLSGKTSSREPSVYRPMSTPQSPTPRQYNRSTAHLEQKASPPVVPEPRPHLVHLLRQTDKNTISFPRKFGGGE
jgi:hypothetical protein